MAHPHPRIPIPITRPRARQTPDPVRPRVVPVPARPGARGHHAGNRGRRIRRRHRPERSGKTTLLRAILGLMPPTTGSLRIFDCACQNLRCYHRARIGYLPQKRAVDPYFPITVREAVLMGRSGAIGLWKRPGKADLAIVRHALEDVGMEDYEDHPLGALSGGQQQRVFIARALAQHRKFYYWMSRPRGSTPRPNTPSWT